MKKIISVVLAMALLLCMVGCVNSNENPGTTGPENNTPPDVTQNDKIKIGIIGQLAADGKHEGYYYEIGMQMVKKMFANAGLGEDKVEFLVLDEGEDGSVLKQRMTELKDRGCIAIIAATGDYNGPASAQWASENSVPVLFCANTSTEMSITNYSDYIFCTGLNAWGFIKVLAQEAVGKQGLTNYAYVGTDGAGAIDAENILLYEGQKINPDFHSVGSYRMGQTETDFSTVIATLLSQKEKPQMTLQQGGNAVISFVMQAAMYDYYSVSSVWSDVITMPFIVPALVEAGVYSYEGSYGATPMAWWNENFKDFLDEYKAMAIEIYGDELLPVEYAMSIYWAGEALLKSVQKCQTDGINLKDGTALKTVLENISFTEFGSEHHFRDFDHQLTMELFFVDAVDAGEEYNHWAMPADVTAVYSAEDYLPTMEEMKEYGERVLGVTDRFE